MLVRLSWVDLTDGTFVATSYRIYRSTAVFTSLTLPAVLATLDDPVLRYDDLTAVADTTYYYMVEAVGSSNAFSTLVEIRTGSPIAVIVGNQYSTFIAPNLTNLSAVFGGGMMLRNPAYGGPALKVADAASASEMEVFFDPYGRVAGALPYGADTRVITLYDQWGADDMVALEGDGIQVVADDYAAGFHTWQIDFAAASAALFSTLDAASAAWSVGRPVWIMGAKRINNSGPFNMHGCRGILSAHMASGLWQGGEDLSWAIDSGSVSAWTGTGWTLDAPASQQFSRLIGDVSQRDGSGYAYFNNVAGGARTFSDPINNYNSGAKYGLGDRSGSGTMWNGLCTELHVFNTTAAMTAFERAFLDSALTEPETKDPALF